MIGFVLEVECGVRYCRCSRVFGCQGNASIQSVGGSLRSSGCLTFVLCVIFLALLNHITQGRRIFLLVPG
jgi:hypothetical protein